MKNNMIISKVNEKIKYINSLKDKKYRDKYNKYIIEGIKIVDEHISSRGTPLEFIVLSKELLFNAHGGEELYNKIKEYNNIIEVDKKIFEHLSDTETPQGILIVVDKKKNTIESLKESIKGNNKFVILDKVSDAGNMGTIIRTAISFGIKNIICIKGTVDAYSSKVVRSTMGAIEKVNIYYLTYDELKDIKADFKENEYVIVGTDLGANNYLNETKPNRKTIYILGNEANGISEEIKVMCDQFVKIPMEEIQESLNVSIAGAILMYNSYLGDEE